MFGIQNAVCRIARPTATRQFATRVSAPRRNVYSETFKWSNRYGWLTQQRAVMKMTPMRIASAGVVGFTAGMVGCCMGTGHGVILMPVLTLPPFNLSHKVAAGTTAIGVALRHVLSIAVFNSGSTMETWDQSVDPNIVAIIAVAGVFAAKSCANAIVNVPKLAMLRLTGLMLMTSGLLIPIKPFFMPDQEQDDERQKKLEEHMKIITFMNPIGITPTDVAKAVGIGLFGGAILGTLGVGPSWMIAMAAPAVFDIPVAASIDTAMMGMLPAAIVSSFVHWRHQHCGPVLSLCALIGVSATAGSVAANRFDIVPAESEIIPRGGVGLLIFLNGVWFMFKKL